jgi:1,4-alpha-glucan branching enzyme
MKPTTTINPKNNNLALARSNSPRTLQISFAGASAHAVYVAGDFNQWNSKSSPLHKDAKGVWRAELQVSPGGHEYRLIVDDQWQDDPHAASFIPNPFGSRNCFVQVA